MKKKKQRVKILKRQQEVKMKILEEVALTLPMLGKEEQGKLIRKISFFMNSGVNMVIATVQ